MKEDIGEILEIVKRNQQWISKNDYWRIIHLIKILQIREAYRTTYKGDE